MARSATSLRPTFDTEALHWATGARFVAGVDEVGRGCLSGPTVAAAVVCRPDASLAAFDWVRDSKTLAKSKIYRYADGIRRGDYHAAGLLAWGIGAASPREIDATNIRLAVIRAMQRALVRTERMLVAAQLLSPEESLDMVLVDGVRLPELPYLHEAQPKLDATSVSTGLASILAKAARDALMKRWARKFPQFACWDSDAGYGSPAHLAALATHGPLPGIHRMTFAPVAAAARDRLDQA